VSPNARIQRCPQEQDDTEEEQTVKNAEQFGDTNSIVGQWSSSVAGTFALRADLFARGPTHFMSETIAYAASKAVLFAPILVPVSGVMAIVAGLSILLGVIGRSLARGLRHFSWFVSRLRCTTSGQSRTPRCIKSNSYSS